MAGFTRSKKSNLQTKKFMDRVLREVMTLSRLHHQHVVRYYQAWLDVEEDGGGDSLLGEEDEFGSSDSATQSNSGEDWFGVTKSSLRNSSHVSKSRNTSPQKKPFKYDFGQASGIFSSSSEESWDQDDITLSAAKIIPNPKELKQVLYIQMEYCTAKTLRNIIDEGVEDEEEVLRLFRQITEGLKHIHSQGMIHRDLKPANIFIDRNGDVAIGDFGLATAGAKTLKSFKDVQKLDKVLVRKGDLTTGVGTAMYLAPEVANKRGAQYDQKVDIYSLGIIFFELCYPFSTQLERAKVLKAVRNSVPEFPPGFAAENPQNAEVILKMLQYNPENRPTAEELLQYLPPKLEEEMLKEAIRSVVANTDSTIYQHLMEKLFLVSAQPCQDFTFDLHQPVQVSCLTELANR